MEVSKIYDLIEAKLLHKWKEEINKSESESWFFSKAEQAYEELEKALNEDEKKLVTTYILAIENKLDYINYNLMIKILNYGIKIGMEVEKSFAAYEE